MLVFFKKHKQVVILIILLVFFVVPFGINCLYKISAPIEWFSTEWNAGDALVFYGSVVASIFTVLGVLLTIEYSHNKYREDIRLRALPYLSSIKLLSKTHFNMFDLFEKELNDNCDMQDSNNDHNVNYKEFKLDSVYFIIEKDRIKQYDSLPEDFRELIHQKGAKWERNGDTLSLRQYSHISYPFQIENVGNGPALNLLIGFNKKDEIELFLPPTQLKCGQSFYVHIVSKDICDATMGDYILNMHYYDIYENEYDQQSVFKIDTNGYGISEEKKQNWIKAQ